MASDLFMDSINALKHHSMIPFERRHAKSVLLGQPKKLMIRNSQNNVPLPKFQIDEYRSMKANQLTKALDEAVPLKHPDALHGAMRYSLIPGGKRMFGTLCIASCELVGGSESAVMPLACAIEMLAAMAIVQDDLPCLDNEDLRRGKPCNHKVFGEAATILACQSLLFLAIEHVSINTKNVPPERILGAIVEICSGFGAEGFSAGQIMDVTSEGKEVVSLSELEFIHGHKSGNFFEAVMVSGGVIGGGSEEEIERLRKCAKCLGLGFQVWDDIVDVIGSPKMTEKTGRDLQRDKATYPKLMGIDRAKKCAIKYLDEAKQELDYFDPTRAAPLAGIINSIIS